MRRNLRGARAVVTGASSGIGRALCVELARNGANLVVTARRAEALETLAGELREKYGVRVEAVPGDITAESTRREVLDAAKEKLGGLDFLINNAGRGAMELVEMTPDETARAILELNYFAPFFLMREAIPELKKAAADSARIQARGGVRPGVVNLGSIVGLRGTPHYGAYGSAKAALINLSDALRAELSPDGIGVLTVSPGTTASEFFDVLLEDRSRPNFPKHRSVPPETVARKIVAALIKGKHRLLPHAESKILHFLDRLCPRLVDRLMAWYR